MRISGNGFAKLCVCIWIVQKENASTKDTVQKQIDALQDQLDGKNSYINNFKKDDVVKSALDKETVQRSAAQGYDKVFEMEDEKDDHSDYCKKCKYESRWCKHRKIRDDNKAQQSAVITSAQTLGWREPYDNLTFGNARVGIMKRTFHDEGHL